MRPHRMRFVLVQCSWLLGTVLVLSMTGFFTYGLFILFSALGVAILTNLLTMSHVQPRWVDRPRILTKVLLAGAAAVLCYRFVSLFVLSP
ncbi:hypothetical protein ACFQMM_05815 [Saliphagus sp. GCM10025308]